jgi:hypothetical protein
MRTKHGRFSLNLPAGMRALVEKFRQEEQHPTLNAAYIALIRVGLKAAGYLGQGKEGQHVSQK